MDSITTQIAKAQQELADATSDSNHIRERITEARALAAEQESATARMPYIDAEISLLLEAELAHQSLNRALNRLLHLQAQAVGLNIQQEAS